MMYSCNTTKRKLIFFVWLPDMPGFPTEARDLDTTTQKTLGINPTGPRHHHKV